MPSADFAPTLADLTSTSLTLPFRPGHLGRLEVSAPPGILARVGLRNGESKRSFFDLLVEVALITVGVFLALLASNWHEDREHRALGQAALRNFAGEMRTNQQAIQQQRQYHETLARELEQFLQSHEPPTKERLERSVHFTGVHPIVFEHTAWDLALATQALSYLPPALAFDISKVYTEQSAFQILENSFLVSAYSPSSFVDDNPRAFATAIQVYLGDVNHAEPTLLQRYEKGIPEVDRALAGQSR